MKFHSADIVFDSNKHFINDTSYFYIAATIVLILFKSN